MMKKLAILQKSKRVFVLKYYRKNSHYSSYFEPVCYLPIKTWLLENDITFKEKVHSISLGHGSYYTRIFIRLYSNDTAMLFKLTWT